MANKIYRRKTTKKTLKGSYEYKSRETLLQELGYKKTSKKALKNLRAEAKKKDIPIINYLTPFRYDVNEKTTVLSSSVIDKIKRMKVKLNGCLVKYNIEFLNKEKETVDIWHSYYVNPKDSKAAFFDDLLTELKQRFLAFLNFYGYTKFKLKQISFSFLDRKLTPQQYEKVKLQQIKNKQRNKKAKRRKIKRKNIK